MTRSTWTVFSLASACAFALAACGDGSGRTGPTSSASSIGSVGDGSDGSAGEDGDGDGGGAKLDQGDGSVDGTAGDGPMADEGCRAVDFLFVIDNSVSMEGEQAALVAAFPGFMNTIQTTLAADTDYHIMVADTDEWGRCNTANPWTGHTPGSDTCNAYVEMTVFDECDRVRGAGVVHPAGAFASNMPCNLQGGKRYIQMGEPDLATAFSCMATVGTAGHPSERPMDGIVEALSPALNAPGACNDGFVREDALLVITFMSDDPNWEDTGMPPDWYNAVVAAKGGDPSAVVVLGLTPAWDGCGGNNDPGGSHWLEFINMFGANGLHGNVCSTAEDYIAFFEMAVGTIDQACQDFTPPG